MSTDNIPAVQSKSPLGRPTLLTTTLTNQIAGLLAKGNYLITACNICGISKQSYLNWLERGEQESENGKGIYFDFLCAIKRAESEAEARRVERIEQAGIGGGLIRKKIITTKDGTVIEDEQYAQPQWLADMTHLERRHPDRWGRKDRTRVDVNERKSITITHVEVVLDKGDGQTYIEGESRELIDDKRT